MTLHVKVRICCIWSFLPWMLLLVCLTNNVVSGRLQSRSSIGEPSSAAINKDEECQQELGEDYVFEDVLQTCVQCTSCPCYKTKDLHCKKCHDFGLVKCETSLEMTTLAITTTPTMTAPSSTQEVTSALHTIVKVLIGLGVPAIVLTCVLLVAWLCWKCVYKPYCQQKQLTRSQQDTQPHDQSVRYDPNSAAVYVGLSGQEQ